MSSDDKDTSKLERLPGFSLPPVSKIVESLPLIAGVIGAIAGHDLKAWMRSAKWPYWLLLPLMALPSVFLDVGGCASALDFIGPPKAVMYAACAVVVFLMLMIAASGPGVANPLPRAELSKRGLNSTQLQNIHRATRAAKDAAGPWPLLWVAWVLLYGFLAFGGDSLGPIQGAIVNLLNNLTAASLYAMYRVMDQETIRVSEESEPIEQSQPAETPQWLVPFVACILLAGVEFALNRAGKGGGMLFETASGLFSGITTALVATRLSSRTLDIPRGWIVLLLAYAVIQPLFPLLTRANVSNEDQLLAVGLTVYAGLGKWALLVVFHWLWSSGRMTYYMLRAVELTRDEPYGFAIFKRLLFPPSEPIEPSSTEQVEVQPSSSSAEAVGAHHEPRNSSDVDR